MTSLSDNQVNQVYDLLVAHGVEFQVLRDELLDHICCLVEQKMEQGAQFHAALGQAEKQFGPLGIERTQEATIYLLTLRLRKMKKTASILGIIGGVTTILGTLFKVMHWPGAGIMLLLGLAITGMLFMPTALYVNYKTKEGVRDKATIVAGFIGGMILTVFALFKIMHWPGASALLILGLGEIILVFIPLYYIKSYRNPENKWFDVGSLTVIMASVIMVLVLYNAHAVKPGYLDMVKRLELETIHSYENLEYEIGQKNEAIVLADASKQEIVQQLDLTTKLLVRSFYQYRNQLLNQNITPDYSYYNNTLSHLNSRNISTYPEWTDLDKELSAFNSSNNLNRMANLKGIVTAYTTLVNKISGVGVDANHLMNLASASKDLPAYNENVGGKSQELVYISQLNMLEYEIRSLQAKILDKL